MKQKIVEGKGCFSSKWNIDTTSNCIGNCTYCYGNYINKRGAVIVKECDTKSLDRQWKKLNSNHNIIRVGKFTDPGFEKDEFAKLIDWMYINKIRPVIVTKMPHITDKVYKQITELNGVYQITIGYDSMEPGIPNFWHNLARVNIGKDKIDAGFNVIFRLVREATGPADKWTKEFINKYKSWILLTPLRLKSKILINNLGGSLSFYDRHKGFYRPNRLHTDYTKLNTCLSSLTLNYCSKCLLE